MNQLERIYRIHDIFRTARRPVPMKRFTQEMECTRNTITRDFAFMRDYLHAPIEYLKEANGLPHVRVGLMAGMIYGSALLNG